MSVEQLRIGIDSETMEALGLGVCLFNRDYQPISWNKPLSELGISAEDAKKQRLSDLLAEVIEDDEIAKKMLNDLHRIFDSHQPYVTRDVVMSFPDKEHGVFHVCLSPLPDEPLIGALIIDDITSVSRSQDQFERILNSTPDGIFLIDKDRQVKIFNSSCGEITGRNPSEIVESGCECSEVINCHTEEGESFATHLCPAKGVFAGEQDHQTEEMLLTNARGEDRWVETTYSPIKNKRGETEYVIGIIRDVHERKVLEEKLHQAEKLASLGQLVAGIAHEIKNPLGIISSSLDVIDNPKRNESEKKDASSFIREEVKRIDERVRAFLNFARPRELRTSSLVPAGLVRNTLSTYEPLFPEINFRFETEGPEAIIHGDEEQLRQVLTNLIFNSADAMENKGAITLRTRCDGEFVLIEVEDDGPGIPQEYINRIFDPFFTTKAEGTGLGLSICYQVILAHRGSMSVAKPSDHTGAIFKIRLPMNSRIDTSSF